MSNNLLVARNYISPWCHVPSHGKLLNTSHKPLQLAVIAVIIDRQTDESSCSLNWYWTAGVMDVAYPI